MGSQILATLFLLVTTLSCVQMQATNTTVNYRLPTTIQPSTYILYLTVPAETFTEASNEFYGLVEIHFTTTVVTNTIQLHANNEFLAISLIRLANETNNYTISDFAVDNVTDIVTIGSPIELQIGTTYLLFLDFNGNLSTTEMTGFYKSSYVDASGITRYLATTQFQPSSARRAFPCFDEPLFKATFDIILTYPLALNALSNTPGSIIDSNTTSQTIAFNTTAVMSTYLIAFVISDFTCSGGLIGTVPYQICSRQDTNDTRDWALEIGPGLLTSLETFTQFRYNISKEKLDQVAIPDFAAGAMENWGLVTYRELYLLWDGNETSNRYKQYIATIIAHEFAHFWFGNLVTCNWWSETFLNEGFATYFEYFTTHEVLPNWQLDKQYVVDVLQPVLINDALENALPLQSDANTSAEVLAKFGRISYSKGGSIFRMVEHLIGSTRFRTGIRNYLIQYAYRTVVPENLWTTLNLVIDNSTTLLPEANLSIVMENWVKNPGFPLLSVTLNGSQVTVTQERFLISGNDTTSKWYVPISFTTSQDLYKFNYTLPYEWITPNSDLVFNLDSANASWIILNNLQTGFYRVTYDNATWNNIRAALLRDEFDGIHEINRAQIVDDLFNLARANKLPYSRVFNIIDFVANDTSYFTWVPTFTGFNFLLARVGLDSRLGQAISSHVLELMQRLYQSVSFVQHNEDDQIYTFTQVLALSSACRLGYAPCTISTSLLYGYYRATGLRPNKNLRGIIYCNALRHSTNQSDWEFLWNAYQNTSLASEQATILSALGCSRDEQLLERYLNLSITDNSGIRPQDALSVFSSVYNGNPIGVDVAFTFLRNNHELIAEKYQSMNALPNLINGIATVFTTQTQVNQLREFIETGGLPSEYVSAANTALESAQANLAWVELFEEDLHAYYFAEEDEATNTTASPTTAPLTTTTPSPDSADKIGVQIVISIFMFILSQLL